MVETKSKTPLPLAKIAVDAKIENIHDQLLMLPDLASSDYRDEFESKLAGMIGSWTPHILNIARGHNSDAWKFVITRGPHALFWALVHFPKETTKEVLLTAFGKYGDKMPEPTRPDNVDVVKMGDRIEIHHGGDTVAYAQKVSATIPTNWTQSFLIPKLPPKLFSRAVKIHNEVIQLIEDSIADGNYRRIWQLFEALMQAHRALTGQEPLPPWADDQFTPYEQARQGRHDDSSEGEAVEFDELGNKISSELLPLTKTAIGMSAPKGDDEMIKFLRGRNWFVVYAKHQGKDIPYGERHFNNASDVWKYAKSLVDEVTEVYVWGYWEAQPTETEEGTWAEINWVSICGHPFEIQSEDGGTFAQRGEQLPIGWESDELRTASLVPLAKVAATLPMPEIPAKYFENNSGYEHINAMVMEPKNEWDHEKFTSIDEAYRWASNRAGPGKEIWIGWIRGGRYDSEEDKYAKELIQKEIQETGQTYGSVDVNVGPRVVLQWKSIDGNPFELFDKWAGFTVVHGWVENGRISISGSSPVDVWRGPAKSDSTITTLAKVAIDEQPDLIFRVFEFGPSSKDENKQSDFHDPYQAFAYARSRVGPGQEVWVLFKFVERNADPSKGWIERAYQSVDGGDFQDRSFPSYGVNEFPVVVPYLGDFSAQLKVASALPPLAKIATNEPEFSKEISLGRFKWSVQVVPSGWKTYDERDDSWEFGREYETDTAAFEAANLQNGPGKEVWVRKIELMDHELFGEFWSAVEDWIARDGGEFRLNDHRAELTSEASAGSFPMPEIPEKYWDGFGGLERCQVWYEPNQTRSFEHFAGAFQFANSQIGPGKIVLLYRDLGLGCTDIRSGLGDPDLRKKIVQDKLMTQPEGEVRGLVYATGAHFSWRNLDGEDWEFLPGASWLREYTVSRDADSDTLWWGHHDETPKEAKASIDIPLSKQSAKQPPQPVDASWTRGKGIFVLEELAPDHEMYEYDDEFEAQEAAEALFDQGKTAELHLSWVQGTEWNDRLHGLVEQFVQEHNIQDQPEWTLPVPFRCGLDVRVLQGPGRDRVVKFPWVGLGVFAIEGGKPRFIKMQTMRALHTSRAPDLFGKKLVAQAAEEQQLGRAWVLVYGEKGKKTHDRDFDDVSMAFRWARTQVGPGIFVVVGLYDAEDNPHHGHPRYRDWFSDNGDDFVERTHAPTAGVHTVMPWLGDFSAMMKLNAAKLPLSKLAADKQNPVGQQTKPFDQMSADELRHEIFRARKQNKELLAQLKAERVHPWVVMVSGNGANEKQFFSELVQALRFGRTRAGPGQKVVVRSQHREDGIPNSRWPAIRIFVSNDGSDFVERREYLTSRDTPKQSFQGNHPELLKLNQASLPLTKKAAEFKDAPEIVERIYQKMVGDLHCKPSHRYVSGGTSKGDRIVQMFDMPHQNFNWENYNSMTVDDDRQFAKQAAEILIDAFLDLGINLKLVHTAERESMGRSLIADLILEGRASQGQEVEVHLECTRSKSSIITKFYLGEKAHSPTTAATLPLAKKATDIEQPPIIDQTIQKLQSAGWTHWKTNSYNSELRGDEIVLNFNHPRILALRKVDRGDADFNDWYVDQFEDLFRDIGIELKTRSKQNHERWWGQELNEYWNGQTRAGEKVVAGLRLGKTRGELFVRFELGWKSDGVKTAAIPLAKANTIPNVHDDWFPPAGDPGTHHSITVGVYTSGQYQPNSYRSDFLDLHEAMDWANKQIGPDVKVVVRVYSARSNPNDYPKYDDMETWAAANLDLAQGQILGPTHPFETELIVIYTNQDGDWLPPHAEGRGTWLEITLNNGVYRIDTKEKTNLDLSRPPPWLLDLDNYPSALPPKQASHTKQASLKMPQVNDELFKGENTWKVVVFKGKEDDGDDRGEFDGPDQALAEASRHAGPGYVVWIWARWNNQVPHSKILEAATANCPAGGEARWIFGGRDLEIGWRNDGGEGFELSTVRADVKNWSYRMSAEGNLVPGPVHTNKIDLQTMDGGPESVKPTTATTHLPLAKMAAQILYHGSPFDGLADDFSNVNTRVMFFTASPAVAHSYAMSEVFECSKSSCGTKVPTIYKVDVSAAKSVDFRKQETRDLYEQHRKDLFATTGDPEDLPPKLTSEGFIMSNDGLPGFGNAGTLKEIFAPLGFDSIWLSEGSQGISLMMWNWAGKVKVVEKTSVEKTAQQIPLSKTAAAPKMPEINDKLFAGKHHVMVSVERKDDAGDYHAKRYGSLDQAWPEAERLNGPGYCVRVQAYWRNLPPTDLSDGQFIVDAEAFLNGGAPPVGQYGDQIRWELPNYVEPDFRWTTLEIVWEANNGEDFELIRVVANGIVIIYRGTTAVATRMVRLNPQMLTNATNAPEALSKFASRNSSIEATSAKSRWDDDDEPQKPTKAPTDPASVPKPSLPPHLLNLSIPTRSITTRAPEPVQQKSKHDWVKWNPEDPADTLYRCKKCGAEKDDGMYRHKVAKTEIAEDLGEPKWSSWSLVEPPCKKEEIEVKNLTIKTDMPDLPPVDLANTEKQAVQSAEAILNALPRYKITSGEIQLMTHVPGWYEGSVPRVQIGDFATFPHAPHPSPNNREDYEQHWLAPFIKRFEEAGYTVVQKKGKGAAAISLTKNAAAEAPEPATPVDVAIYRTDKDEGRVDGREFTDIHLAFDWARRQVGPGLAVRVMPLFYEQTDKGILSRLWVSADGADFEERVGPQGFWIKLPIVPYLGDFSRIMKLQAAKLPLVKKAVDENPGELVRIHVHSTDGELQHHYLNKGEWAAPAGRLDPGDTVEEAASRELEWRTGYHADPGDFVLLQTEKRPDGWVEHHVEVKFEKLEKRGPPQTEIRFASNNALPLVKTAAFLDQFYSDMNGEWSVKDIFRYAVANLKPKNIAIEDLLHNLQPSAEEKADEIPGSPEFVQRAKQADLKYPIIAVKYPDGIFIADGVHRLWKAKDEGLEEIKGYLLDQEELNQIPHHGPRNPPLAKAASSLPMPHIPSHLYDPYGFEMWRVSFQNSGEAEVIREFETQHDAFHYATAHQSPDNSVRIAWIFGIPPSWHPARDQKVIEARALKVLKDWDGGVGTASEPLRIPFGVSVEISWISHNAGDWEIKQAQYFQYMVQGTTDGEKPVVQWIYLDGAHRLPKSAQPTLSLTKSASESDSWPASIEMITQAVAKVGWGRVNVVKDNNGNNGDYFKMDFVVDTTELNERIPEKTNLFDWLKDVTIDAFYDIGIHLKHTLGPNLVGGKTPAGEGVEGYIRTNIPDYGKAKLVVYLDLGHKQPEPEATTASLAIARKGPTWEYSQQIPLAKSASSNEDETPTKVVVWDERAERRPDGLTDKEYERHFSNIQEAFADAFRLVGPGKQVGIYPEFAEKLPNGLYVRRSWHNNNDEGWFEVRPQPGAKSWLAKGPDVEWLGEQPFVKEIRGYKEPIQASSAIPPLKSSSLRSSIVAASALLAYHYPADPSDLKSISQNGLLAPSALAAKDLFKPVEQNYHDRVVEATGNKDVSPELVLEYLDHSNAELDPNTFQLGRNLVFALLQPIPKGVSSEHDELADQAPVQINLEKVAKLPGVKFFMVEMPLNDDGAEVDLEDLRWLSGIEMMDFFDNKHAEGMLFGGVPHLAIYVPNGVIPPDCLKIAKTAAIKVPLTKSSAKMPSDPPPILEKIDQKLQGIGLKVIEGISYKHFNLAIDGEAIDIFYDQTDTEAPTAEFGLQQLAQNILDAMLDLGIQLRQTKDPVKSEKGSWSQVSEGTAPSGEKLRIASSRSSGKPYNFVMARLILGGKAADPVETKTASVSSQDRKRVRAAILDWQQHKQDFTNTAYWTKRFAPFEEIFSRAKPTSPTRLYRSERTDISNQYDQRFTSWSLHADSIHNFGWGKRRTVSAIIPPEQILVSMPHLGLDPNKESMDEVIVKPGQYVLETGYPDLQTGKYKKVDEMPTKSEEVSDKKASKHDTLEQLLETWQNRSVKTTLEPTDTTCPNCEAPLYHDRDTGKEVCTECGYKETRSQTQLPLAKQAAIEIPPIGHKLTDALQAAGWSNLTTMPYHHEGGDSILFTLRKDFDAVKDHAPRGKFRDWVQDQTLEIFNDCGIKTRVKEINPANRRIEGFGPHGEEFFISIHDAYLLGPHIFQLSFWLDLGLQAKEASGSLPLTKSASLPMPSIPDNLYDPSGYESWRVEIKGHLGFGDIESHDFQTQTEAFGFATKHQSPDNKIKIRWLLGMPDDWYGPSSVDIQKRAEDALLEHAENDTDGSEQEPVEVQIGWTIITIWESEFAADWELIISVAHARMAEGWVEREADGRPHPRVRWFFNGEKTSLLPAASAALGLALTKIASLPMPPIPDNLYDPSGYEEWTVEIRIPSMFYNTERHTFQTKHEAFAFATKHQSPDNEITLKWWLGLPNDPNDEINTRQAEQALLNAPKAFNETDDASKIRVPQGQMTVIYGTSTRIWWISENAGPWVLEKAEYYDRFVDGHLEVQTDPNGTLLKLIPHIGTKWYGKPNPLV